MRRIAGIVLSLWLASLWGQALAGFPGFTVFGAGGGGGSPVTLTTLTLVNDSTSLSMSANQPTQSFGWPFADNAACSSGHGGTNQGAPIFDDSGTTQPYSVGEQAYWPSGCLKFAAFSFKPTFTLAVSASFTGVITASTNHLTVSSVTGTISTGQAVWDTTGNINQAGTTITGSCGANCYTLSNTFSSGVASEAMNATTFHTINVKCCGNWPTAGSGTAGAHRTLTEVYTQNVNAQMPSNTALTDSTNGNHLATNGTSTGSAITWGSWLKNDANNYNITKWMDGDAETCWKVSTKMAQTQGGTAHGQMVFDHYVCGLNDGSNSLAGFRWLGAARQPFYNQSGEGSTIPAKAFRVFATPVYAVNGTVTNGPNWQSCVSVTSCTAAPGNQSGAIPLSWAGSDGNPLVAVAYTASSGTLNTNSANNFFMGSAAGADPNEIPCQFTGGVSHSATAVYWCDFPSNVNIRAWLGGARGIVNCCTESPSNGTGNVVPVPVLEPFGKIYFADPNGRYNFFQGQGDQTAETPARVAINQSYFASTHVWPPYDQSVSGVTKGGTVPYTFWNRATLGAYNPWVIGQFLENQQQPGDHPDLGPLPNDVAIGYYTDAPVDDYIIRAEGLSAGLTPGDFKDAATDTIPNLIDSSTSTYTGMPNSVASTLSLSFGSCSGFSPGSCPPSGTGPSGFSNIDASHKPEYAAGAYLKTGELQFGEALWEQATFGVAVDGDTTNRNPTDPANGSVTLRGVITASFAGSQPRTAAWDHRTLQWAAALVSYDPTGTSPTYDYGGTLNTGQQLGKYLTDWAENNLKFAAHAMDPANSLYGTNTTYVAGCSTAPTTICAHTGRGFVLGGPKLNSPQSGDVINVDGEETSYNSFAYLIAYGMRQSANAKKWLDYRVTGRYYTLTHFGGYYLGQLGATSAYIDTSVGQNNTYYGTPPIPDDSSWVPGVHSETQIFGSDSAFYGVAQASPSSGSPSFTMLTSNNFPVRTGDLVVFCVISDNIPLCGLDVSAATNGTTSTSSAVLNFSTGSISTLTGTAPGVSTGAGVYDTTTSQFIGIVSSVGSTTITLVANAANAVGNGDTLRFTGPQGIDFTGSTSTYVIRDATHTGTVGSTVTTTFNLATCTTWSNTEKTTCSTPGSAIATRSGFAAASLYPSLGGALYPGKVRFVQTSTDGTTYGPSVLNSFAAGEVEGMYDYAAWNWYRNLVGGGSLGCSGSFPSYTLAGGANAADCVLYDLFARLATDGFSPATGSPTYNPLNANGGFVPRYSMHY